MGRALPRIVEAGRERWGAIARFLALGGLLLLPASLASQRSAPVRLDRDRFTAIAFAPDVPLARSLLASATSRDTFPGLPRPTAAVLIAIAPDARRFRAWIGPAAPEWGAAVAFPAQRRIVMQGRSAASDAGDPRQVLRHELAHLALHEYLGDLPPRWFDEGYASYAAGEWGREETLATSVALLLRGVPSLDSLDAGFAGGAARADAAYALAYRAVAELAALDTARGLTLFFRYWKESGSLERALRGAYGLTQADFERRWAQRTRRRFGGLAFLANVTLGIGLTLLMVLPLYVARRRRDRRRLAALRAADEAAERENRDSALAELLRTIPPAPPSGRPPATGS